MVTAHPPPPPPEPPRIQAALEIHQPAPARDPERILSLINEGLDALARMQSSALVSVLATRSGSTAASVLCGGSMDSSGSDPNKGASEALRKAVEVIERELAACPVTFPVTNDPAPASAG
jgi:hypothetical protein